MIRGLASSCAAMCLASAAAAQQAQPLTPADPTLALPAAPQPSTPLDNDTLAAPSAQTQGVSPAPTFVLRSVEFHGAAVVSQADLAPAWEAYRGKPVSLRDLRAIAAAGERIYARSGHPFVALVVPAQDVAGGAVRIEVIEGRVSDLTVVGRNPVARRQAAAAFQPLVGRRPLDADAVERAYDLAQDVPGLALAGSLRPGSQPGGMDLVVKAERRAWRLYVNVNNFYPDPVGPWGVLLGGEYNGASTYGDQTTLQLFSTTDVAEQQVVRASHSRRLNAAGTTVTGAILYATADPKGVVAPLDLATDVVAARLELAQPLVLRDRFSLTGALAFDWTDQQTKVFSDIDLTRDHVRVLVGRLFGRVGEERSPLADYSLELRQGISGLGASRSADPNLSRFEADPQATVVRGSASGEIGRPDQPRLAWRVEGQWSNASLTAPEEYVVGNLSVGRGFEPGASYGDRALALSLEGRLGAWRPREGLSLEPYAFVDAVEVWNKEPGAPDGRWVASVGAGVRLELLQKGRFDIFYAQPLDSPLGLGERKPGGGVYVNFTAALPDVFRSLGAGLHRIVR